MLKQIQLLYRIEARLREQKAGPASRQAVRAAQSKPVVERIKKACTLLARKKRFLPQDAISRAMAYAIAQMPGLEVFLEDGKIEIDNNLVENGYSPHSARQKELAVHW
jgi:transposase